MQNLIIDSEFHTLLEPLTEEEYSKLEESILSEGCRDALVVWNETIIDGHNRYEICTKHDLPYETTPRIFDSKDDAILWIIDNQSARRNYSLYQKGIVALRKKDILAKRAKENQIRKPESVLAILPEQKIDTREQLAEEAGMSGRTLDKIEKIESNATEDIKQKIRDGNLSISKVYKDIIREEKRQIIKVETFQPIMPGGLFDVIYADPPWKYEFAESSNREIENQYSTMSLEEIKSLKIPSADNAVLLLWATSPKLEEALQVLNAWGFIYRTCAVWDKEIIGMGYWFRQQHEILLLGVKGTPKCPDAINRFSSVFSEKRGQHSKKPDHYYAMIERMFPNKRYIELFARDEREGWSSYGNQK